jgi:hypothetical protein
VCVGRKNGRRHSFFLDLFVSFGIYPDENRDQGKKKERKKGRKRKERKKNGRAFKLFRGGASVRCLFIIFI